MKTIWFTFGQAHAHVVGAKTVDKDVVVKITADDPRKRMVELFGTKWSMEYHEDPMPLGYWKECIEL